MDRWFVDYVVEARRRQEQLAEAERYRKAQITRTNSKSFLASIYQRWMVELGNLMVAVGNRLLCRYQDTFDISAVGHILKAKPSSTEAGC